MVVMMVAGMAGRCCCCGCCCCGRRRGVQELLVVLMVRVVLDHLALSGCRGRRCCNVQRAATVNLVQDVWVQVRS